MESGMNVVEWAERTLALSEEDCILPPDVRAKGLRLCGEQWAKMEADMRVQGEAETFCGPPPPPKCP